jgi:hypothetical protein
VLSLSIKIFSHRDELPAGTYLTDCAVSGGTLKGFLREALQAAQGQLCVRIFSASLDFLLPCFSGIGTTPAAIPSCTMHFSEALCTEYGTYVSQGQLHAVLRDRYETLQKKLLLAESLHIPMALIEDPELRKALTGR